VQFLILSDIHANWHALEAVLKDAKDRYQQIVCCGDLVGYNAQPRKVTQWVRENCATVIRGNHDKVVAGIEDLEWFNEVAQAAARWTMEHLESAEIDYLRELPKGAAKTEYFSICHGSISDEDEYVAYVRDALPHFAESEMPLTFFGHTHLQGGFFAKQSRVGLLPRLLPEETETTIELMPDYTYLVNPGSVGQPRDGDPRAAYAIYDTDKKLVTLRRTEYPIYKTASEIRDAGLPDVLGLRLFHGA
jgi:predicted phosphodiesterase